MEAWTVEEQSFQSELEDLEEECTRGLSLLADDKWLQARNYKFLAKLYQHSMLVPWMDNRTITPEKYRSNVLIWDLYEFYTTSFMERMWAKIGSDEDYTSKNPKKLAKILHFFGELTKYHIHGNSIGIYREDSKNLNETLAFPERDIFVWSIYFGKLKIQDQMWQKLQNPIGGALAASLLLQEVANQANKHKEFELEEIVQERTKYFEEKASQLLRKCYATDTRKTYTILTRELPEWGRSSLLYMAMGSGKHGFIYENACQSKLIYIFKGRLSLYTSTPMICLDTIMPFFVIYSRFQTRDIAIEKQETKQIKVDGLNRSSDTSSSSDYGDDDVDRDIVVGNSARTVLCPPTKITSTYIGILPALLYQFRSPNAKFVIHGVAHVAFLWLFNWTLLTQFSSTSGYEHRVSHYEQIIFWCTAGFLCNNLNQTLNGYGRSLYDKVRTYLFRSPRVFWNYMDIALFIVFLFVILFRYNFKKPEMQRDVFVAYGIILIICYLRLTSYFLLWKSIGYKVLMIWKMLQDLGFFLYILVIFMLGFGIPLQAILHPDDGFNFKNMVHAVYAPYFNIFGDLFLSRTTGELANGRECTTNLTLHEQNNSIMVCPKNHAAVIYIIGIYMILMNVLILNLLIAIFGNTFARLQLTGDQVWCYNTAGLVYDAYHLPPFPPPLNIIWYMFKILLFLARGCRSKKLSNLSSIEERMHFCVSLESRIRNNQINRFEQGCRWKLIQETAESEQKAQPEAFKTKL